MHNHHPLLRMRFPAVLSPAAARRQPDPSHGPVLAAVHEVSKTPVISKPPTLLPRDSPSSSQPRPLSSSGSLQGSLTPSSNLFPALY